MGKFFKGLFSYIAKRFKSGQAKKDLETVEHFIDVAVPYIKMAEEIAAKAGFLPPGVDAAWHVAMLAFPALFDGSDHTQDQWSSMLMGFAAKALEVSFPQLDTTVARMAVQSAYPGHP
jgi:hypothetical protein